MKVATMRWVDAWLGAPLCFIASAALALARRLAPRPPAAAGARSVLVIKLSELGALVTIGPAMRSLARMAGRENLYFLSFDQSRALLEILDFVPPENVFTVRTDSPGSLIVSALGVLRRIRARRIECSVDLDFFSRATALVALLSGCRRRVGCHAYFGEGPYRGNLLTHRVKHNPHVHVSRMFEALAKAAEQPAGGFPRLEFAPAPAETPDSRFTPTAGELASVRRMLAEVGAGPADTLILLNSNISDREALPLRKWSDERYVELARLILDGAPNAFVLLTGSAKEAGTIARLEADVGRDRCRSVAGKTTLREFLTLIAGAAVLVTNDSGPAHFATLTGVAVVVLFGPETPLLWRPLGERVHVVYRGLACSPCFTVANGRRSLCRRNACMDILPAKVYQAVQKCLALP